jgi:hypothetical protein
VVDAVVGSMLVVVVAVVHADAAGFGVGIDNEAVGRVAAGGEVVVAFEVQGCPERTAEPPVVVVVVETDGAGNNSAVGGVAKIGVEVGQHGDSGVDAVVVRIAADIVGDQVVVEVCKLNLH